jgi:hypothetical protein
MASLFCDLNKEATVDLTGIHVHPPIPTSGVDYGSVALQSHCINL